MRRILTALALALPLSSFGITAKSYMVMDLDGNVVLSENADEVRAIASITKLVTTSKSAQAAADEEIVITRDDMVQGRMRSTPLRVGSKYTRAQLMELALVSSDNVAAIALGRTAPSELGSELPQHTTILEASGLNSGNRSTAREVAELARTLHNTGIAEMSVRQQTEIGKRHSTNPLLGKPGWTFFLSKTGFINDSGGCLVVIMEVGGKNLIFALLGSKDVRQRWRDLYELRKELDETDFTAPEWKAKSKVIKKRKKR